MVNWDTAMTVLLVASAFVAIVSRAVLARRAARSGTAAARGCSAGCSGCVVSESVSVPEGGEACGGER